MKVFLPSGGVAEPALPSYGPDGPTFDDALPRPNIRTYTPRRFDAAALELTVDFVIHEGGPASDWAAHAAPGDKAAIAGPGRGYDFDHDARSFVIGGDEPRFPRSVCSSKRSRPKRPSTSSPKCAPPPRASSSLITLALGFDGACRNPARPRAARCAPLSVTSRCHSYLAGSTIWVHRNKAICRPVDSFVMVASQTWV